jgi:hypothetical protein
MSTKVYPKYLTYVYFALSPILWLPFVSSERMRLLKIVLFLFIVFFLFMSTIAKTKIFLPKKVLFFSILCLIFFTPYLIISNNFKGALNSFFNYFSSFLMVVIGLNFSAVSEDKKSFFCLLLLVNLYCVFPICNFLLGIPEWQDWAPISDFRSAYLPKPFWVTGFNGGRTGWSESIALFIPLSFAVLHKQKQFLFKLFSITVIIVAAQVISGGRNGLAASFLAFAIITLKEIGLKRMLLFSLLLGFIYIIFFFQYTNDILVSLRIYDEASEALSDNLTTDRYIMYEAFPTIFLESPFLGKGFLGSQQSLYPKYLSQDGIEMHNGLLRVFIDHGLFFGSLMAFLIVFSLYKALKLIFSKKNNMYTTMFSAIIVQGIFISLFQPLSLFGGFQISALWWFALGMVLKNDYEK